MVSTEEVILEPCKVGAKLHPFPQIGLVKPGRGQPAVKVTCVVDPRKVLSFRLHRNREPAVDISDPQVDKGVLVEDVAQVSVPCVAPFVVPDTSGDKICSRARLLVHWAVDIDDVEHAHQFDFGCHLRGELDKAHHLLMRPVIRVVGPAQKIRPGADKVCFPLHIDVTAI